MTRYLVTGGAGFIGSHIAEALVKRGDSVRILDNFSTGFRDNFEDFSDTIEVFDADVTDAKTVAEAVDGVDCVFHQAALASVPRSVEHPLATNAACVTGTLTVSDSFTSPTSLSDLQSIKANFSGTSFAYYGIQGTTKELSDARDDSGYDWIKNITAQNGAKSFTLTDLGLDTTHQAALIGTGADALDNTYLINQNGLTSNSSAYLHTDAHAHHASMHQ